MLYDKFHRRNDLIVQYLHQLETGKHPIDWYQAYPPEPVLRDVFSAQEKLLTALERLLDARKSKRIPDESLKPGLLLGVAA